MKMSFCHYSLLLSFAVFGFLLTVDATTSPTTVATTTSSTPTTTATTPTVRNTTSTQMSTRLFTGSTTKKPDEEICAERNGSCKDCLEAPQAKCLWCGDRCVVYPKSEVLPTSGDCDLKNSKWGTCLVSFFYLLIGMSVVGGVLLLALVICCCCCCRKKKNGDSAWLRMQERFDRDKDERRAKHSEKRADRERRNDEIRRKYGLVKDGDQPYQRFEDNDK